MALGFLFWSKSASTSAGEADKTGGGDQHGTGNTSGASSGVWRGDRQTTTS